MARDIWLVGLSGVHRFCSYRGSIGANGDPEAIDLV